MTTEGDQLIAARLDTLEDSIQELKDLIKQEIADLKTEQIADLRRDNARLADDQRRAWDAIRSLELSRERAHGGGKVLQAVIAGIIAIVTSSAAAVFIPMLMRHP